MKNLKLGSSRSALLFAFGSSILMASDAMAQSTTFDELKGNYGSNKSISWTTSMYQNGYGHKIYGIDQQDGSGTTQLRIANRNNATSWSDALTISSNGKIGVGTNSPSEAFEVAGNSGQDTYLKIKRVATNDLPYGTEGIKIGSAQISVFTYPSYGSGKLTISNGNNPIFFPSSSPVYFGQVPAQGGNAGKYGFSGLVWATSLTVSNYSEPGSFQWNMPNGFMFSVNGKSYFNNYVGIGSSCNPIDVNVKLGVKGKILCEELKVKMEGGTCWADYVFSESYKLSPLAEVEAFIKKNKHLPDVPSEKEVTENGLEVSDILRIQMQKIEEVTLYMIEMQKEIKNLKNSNQQLKAELNSLSN